MNSGWVLKQKKTAHGGAPPVCHPGTWESLSLQRKASLIQSRNWEGLSLCFLHMNSLPYPNPREVTNSPLHKVLTMRPTICLALLSKSHVLVPASSGLATSTATTGVPSPQKSKLLRSNKSSWYRWWKEDRVLTSPPCRKPRTLSRRKVREAKVHCFQYPGDYLFLVFFLK